MFCHHCIQSSASHHRYVSSSHPWPTLTLIVSLEAIFLSTFVMIGQNRQAAFQQTKADQDYSTEHTLLVDNTDITRLIHELTEAIHQRLVGEAPLRREAFVTSA